MVDSCPSYVLCRFFPGVKETMLLPIDVMHLEGDGLLGYELYYLMYILLRRKYFTLEILNRRIANAPASVWTDGKRVRPMHSSVIKGAKNGRSEGVCMHVVYIWMYPTVLGMCAHMLCASLCLVCRPLADKRARYTAAETHKFALASEALLNDLLPQTEPAWVCWLKHVEYLRVMLQDSFTPQDILKLDNLIFEHQTLFSKVRLVLVRYLMLVVCCMHVCACSLCSSVYSLEAVWLHGDFVDLDT